MGNFVVYLALVGVIFIAAVAQIILKKSALIKREREIFNYLNPYVISAYIIQFGTILANMIIHRYIDFKVYSAFAGLSYVFVILLSKVFLKEDITRKRWLGMGLIVAGVAVFNL